MPFFGGVLLRGFYSIWGIKGVITPILGNTHARSVTSEFGSKGFGFGGLGFRGISGDRFDFVRFPDDFFGHSAIWGISSLSFMFVFVHLFIQFLQHYWHHLIYLLVLLVFFLGGGGLEP